MASSLVGDEPTPTTREQPPRKVKTGAHDQVTVSMPTFEGHYKPELYIEWECEIDNIFFSHNFSEHKKVKFAIGTFTGLASIWWNEYCRLYPDYIPTTWHDLKLAMRYKFVPSYYTRDMVKKLQNLKQGNNNVKEYCANFETTLLHSFLEESEEDLMDRFWRGLNHDIQEILLHEDEIYSVDHLFCLACKVEQEIRRRGNKTGKCSMELLSSTTKKVNPSTAAPTMPATQAFVGVTPPQTRDVSASTVPTSSECDIYSNNNGTDSVPPHDIVICHDDLNTSCIELPVVLVTPLVLEDIFTDLNISCDQTIEMATNLSAPIT